MTGKAKLRFLPGAVQQLKLVAGADTTCHFCHPRNDITPHLLGPHMRPHLNDQIKNCDLQWTRET